MLRYVSNPRDAQMTQRSDEQKSLQMYQKRRQDGRKLVIGLSVVERVLPPIYLQFSFHLGKLKINLNCFFAHARKKNIWFK